jgi:Tfp pilus assembly protein FimT
MSNVRCQTSDVRADNRAASGAFTIVELLVVTGIIALLLVLVVPAFTNIKSAGDVTSGAYTIKGVLEQARSYAMANNTYTWVGFAGSIGTPVTGQVSIAVIASTDGTSSGTGAQLGKLIQLQNTHIGDTGVPSNNGTEFESRPNVPPAYRISSAGSGPPFTLQQTTFTRWVRFSPRGEALVSGATQIARYVEVGVLPTNGSTLATPNIVAIEIGGSGGSLKIYRR